MKKILKFSMIALVLSCHQHRPPKVKTQTEDLYQVSYDHFKKIDREFLVKGQERYEIYCMVCHGPLGEGKRFNSNEKSPPAPGLHSQKLKEVRPDYFYEVITYGKGKMGALGTKIAEEDRWAIAYYVRMLQLSADLEKRNKQ